MATRYVCVYCKRDNFLSFKGLQQHQIRNVSCRAKIESIYKSPEKSVYIAHDFMAMMPIIVAKQSKQSAKSTGTNAKNDTTTSNDKQSSVETNNKKRSIDKMNDNIQHHNDLIIGDDNSDVSIVEFSMGDEGAVDLEESNEFLSSEEEDDLVCNKNMRKSFQDYAQNQQELHGFSEAEIGAMKLLFMLRKTKAPLNTYESVMYWHFCQVGAIHPRQTVRQCTQFVTREKLFKRLRERYKYDKGYHNITTITLPHTKAKARIVWNDAREVITSLLTDPRITDDDYTFWEDNPLASPPERVNYVEDLITGRAYMKTYKALIKQPGTQVLLPVLFYIDAATTGQFADLPVTAVKISLGIFSRKAREKDYCWRILGYVPAVMKHKSKGRRIMLDSMHMDGVMAHQDALEDEGIADNDKVEKAQDFHSMLEVVLRSYVILQDSGFVWDLPYKGKWFKDIEFVLFTPFIKVDGEEADKLCGKYLSRTRNVAQLCRYCECPTNKSDDPRADYRLKTKRRIRALIEQNNTYQLQQLSQHAIQNCMYDIRFGLHNKQGIHGACPWEMLHALLLGLFRYTRDCFFTQIGETSKTADDINALSKQFGELLSRQSDRDMPITRFANGIKRGKLMASEYPGILLCMALRRLFSTSLGV